MINHTLQRETSHFRLLAAAFTHPDMDENETFRLNLIRLMRERGLKAAQLSKLADLNARAVTDIEEGRAQSPKISTVFKLAKALQVDPAELMGLGPRLLLNRELAEFLSQYSETEQERLLQGLSALHPPKS